jgi:hypothetical protein
VVAEREPGGAVIWKACRAGASSTQGQGSWQAGGCSCLAPGWCLSQRGRAPVVPNGAGVRQGLMGRVDSGHPTCGWGSAGPEGQLAWREVWVFQQAVGPAPGWGLAQTGGRDPSGRGSGSTAKVRVFLRGVGPKAGGQRG